MTIEEMTKVSCEEYYASEAALERESDEVLERESECFDLTRAAFSTFGYEEVDLFESMAHDLCCDNLNRKWYAEDFIDGLSDRMEDENDQWVSCEFE